MFNGINTYGFIFSNKLVFSNEYPNECRCCEYRQFVSRKEVDVLGQIGGTEWRVVRKDEVYEPYEDCPNGRCYGHRRDMGQDGDRYSQSGCEYNMLDVVGYNFMMDIEDQGKEPGKEWLLLLDRIRVKFRYEFMFVISDQCRGGISVFTERHEKACPEITIDLR